MGGISDRQVIGPLVSCVYPDIKSSSISVVSYQYVHEIRDCVIWGIEFYPQKMPTVSGVITRRAEAPRYS